ncbi:MAG: LysR family transcriptional regulator [Rhizobiaceae bacterium]|nr:LysR family transcriptional regulator [Rhizobiaceae bacterium]
MHRPDLNLLVALDVLLAEGNVARAARRLRLSPSAMSRQLARLRRATGDPLLVRAGRGLVPTPRALELRSEAGRIVGEAGAVLRPVAALDLPRLSRSFTLRCSEGFVETFGPALLARIAGDAPGVRLRFVNKRDRESLMLREGAVDLETGVVGARTSPEVHTQALFRDRFVGVVRPGSPLSDGEVTRARYLAAGHILVSRHGEDEGPVSRAIAAAGLRLEVAVTVEGFATAVQLARRTDLVAAVPGRHSAGLCGGMVRFALPVAVPDVPISLFWHPRLHADPAHRWLRACVRQVCSATDAGDPAESGFVPPR